MLLRGLPVPIALSTLDRGFVETVAPPKPSGFFYKIFGVTISGAWDRQFTGLYSLTIPVLQTPSISFHVALGKA